MATVLLTVTPAFQSSKPLKAPIKYANIYVDDFLALCQGNK
jgi:hypothetical protein